jgi:hypothetical protein
MNIPEKRPFFYITSSPRTRPVENGWRMYPLKVLSPIQRALSKRPSFLLSLTAVIAAVLCCNMTTTSVLFDAFFAVDSDALTSWSLGAFGDLPNANHQHHYDWNLSTEENYRVPMKTNNINQDDGGGHNSDHDKKNDDNKERHGFYGHFRKIRQQLLDHKFHAIYSKERQAVQDSILLSLLPTTVIHDVETGRECNIPTQNWIVFTAGCYGYVTTKCA